MAPRLPLGIGMKSLDPFSDPTESVVGPGFLSNDQSHVARVYRQFLEDERTDSIDCSTQMICCLPVFIGGCYVSQKDPPKKAEESCSNSRLLYSAHSEQVPQRVDIFIRQPVMMNVKLTSTKVTFMLSPTQ